MSITISSYLVPLECVDGSARRHVPHLDGAVVREGGQATEIPGQKVQPPHRSAVSGLEVPQLRLGLDVKHPGAALVVSGGQQSAVAPPEPSAVGSLAELLAQCLVNVAGGGVVQLDLDNGFVWDFVTV